MQILCISFAIALLDQLAKHVVQANLRLGEGVTVVSGLLDMHYVQNTGAAWGILRGTGVWLIALSIAMLLVLISYRRHFAPECATSRIAAGLLAGGIVGNLIDRIRLGYVVDFIDFYWRGHHFPAFNVADSAICIGVGLYMIMQLRETKARADEPDTGAGAT
jgi:signal peptidase II